jgi:hypothetical protein
MSTGPMVLTLSDSWRYSSRRSATDAAKAAVDADAAASAAEGPPRLVDCCWYGACLVAADSAVASTMLLTAPRAISCGVSGSLCVCWSVLECVGVCWSVLECVGVCWSVGLCWSVGVC